MPQDVIRPHQLGLVSGLQSRWPPSGQWQCGYNPQTLGYPDRRLSQNPPARAALRADEYHRRDRPDRGPEGYTQGLGGDRDTCLTSDRARAELRRKELVLEVLFYRPYFRQSEKRVP